ncbi:MAG TPA: NAD-dependent epimerase/dehydratase family protein [Fimbriiglobus sp.]|jgi:nucleoside-diphosphate-sugar epimerase
MTGDVDRACDSQGNNVTGSTIVIGCGYLGMRVAAAWQTGGRRVHALTRGREGLFSKAGIVPILGDVTDPSSLTGLPSVETVIYAVGLDRSVGKPMRAVYIDGLANVLDSLPTPARFLHVSSSSVYGQSAGEWVTEESPTEPTEESGKVVLEAERLLTARMPTAVILRFAGIYGPGRLLREKAIRAGEPLVGDAEKWLNLIHVDDGVRAVLAAETRAVPGEIYNVADGEPVSRRDFYSELARVLSAPPARFEPGQNARGESHRRVSNGKARNRLGFALAYPNYQAGLAAC